MGKKYHAKIFTKEPQKRQILVFCVVLFSFGIIVVGELGIVRTIAKQNEQKLEQEDRTYFQRLPIESDFLQFQKFLKKNKKYRQQLEAIQKDAVCFPIPTYYWKEIAFENSWGGKRTFGGERVHEGCDIMALDGTRGKIPVMSMSDGTVENKGWLRLGGWRIGIRAPHGTYFYYAHFDSYVDGIEVGDPVYAGQLLGFMGDSGYGVEGTIGQFDVHLHIGIYLDKGENEWSVNPYEILNILKNRKKFG